MPDPVPSAALVESAPTRALAPLRTLDLEASGDVREFMARPPHWLLRSGTTALAALLALLLVLSIVIKYPDTISARITIIGTQPVVEVMARQSGHLESLRVHEGQHVSSGEILAIIQNPARPERVFDVSAKLAVLAGQLSERKVVLSQRFEAGEDLGKLQASYADFLHALHQFESRQADDYAEKAAKLLGEQVTDKGTQIESLRAQSEMTHRELDLARAKFERTKMLHDGKTVSTAEFQEQEMVFLAQMRSETMAQRALTDAQIEAAKMEKSLRDLEHERAETLLVAREELRSSLNKLRGEIDAWETEHVLRASAEGTVAFYDFWSDQQYVTAGKQVFLVVPETTQLLGRIPVATGGAGKIKAGQKVRIRLDDFPYKEFGVVTGSVQSVSMVARDGANLVLVDIPHPLVTSFKRRLQFKQEMTGQAQIVMEDIRLLGRVLYEIRRAFVNNTDA